MDRYQKPDAVTERVELVSNSHVYGAVGRLWERCWKPCWKMYFFHRFSMPYP